MTYATDTEFDAAFGAAERSDLISDAHTFERAAADADGLIDGYVASRYTLPLVVVPTMVKAWALDIVRYRLWDQQAPEEVRRRYEDAIAQLKDLAAGRVSLPPGSDSTPEAGVEIAFAAYSAERVFTADTLKDF